MPPITTIRVGWAVYEHPMNIIFVCNEELKGGLQGYSLCLFGNQLKLQLQPFGCKRARVTITKDL